MSRLFDAPVVVRHAFAALLLTGGVLASLPATAGLFSPSCATQPRSTWLSSYELSLRLQRSGYEMVRLRMGNERCVDVVAKDRNGRFVDLQVNPFNAEIVRGGN